MPSLVNALRTVSEHASFGGVQGFYEHASDCIGLPMRFGVFVPPQARTRKVPGLFYLAGLTCTEETFAVKACPQRLAAELGLLLVTPDTSPRNTGIKGATVDWDLGEGAGFYVDARSSPWSAHWRMESYVTDELRDLVAARFPVDVSNIGIFGHSMGGHGALTLALRHPRRYRSVSALSPIAAPMQCPWGQKAFNAYLGSDQARWAEHDATALIIAGSRMPPPLIDQGLDDKFLAAGQLLPDKLETACISAGQPLTLRRHEGYDHGYYFIATFLDDHLRHHAKTLCG